MNVSFSIKGSVIGHKKQLEAIHLQLSVTSCEYNRGRILSVPARGHDYFCHFEFVLWSFTNVT